MYWVDRIRYSLCWLKRLIKWKVKRPDYAIISESVMELRESHLRICMELDKLKNKFSGNSMIEAICITACEMEKIGKALKKLQREGF